MFLPKRILFFAFLLIDTSVWAEDEEPAPRDQKGEGAPLKKYMFDQNAYGVECDKALEKNEDEDFRLFCINQRQGFQQCALTCSDLLHFESSLGVCKPNRCNFWETTFETKDGSIIKPTPGKVHLFAFSPTWEGHAQYAYELLEQIRGEFVDTTEALLLPIDIHDYELTHPRFEATPFESPLVRRVEFLREIFPRDISQHSFLNFVRTLVHRSGAKNFDVYTDRFVIFVMSADGTLARRLVAPTLEQLREIIKEFGGESTPSINVI